MKYELKKLFTSRILLIGLLISCLFSVYESYRYCIARYANHKTTELELYLEKTYKGEYTVQKAEELKNLSMEATKNWKADYENDELRQISGIYSSVYGWVNLHDELLVNRRNIVKNAKRLQKSPVPYTAKVNKKIEKLYSKNPEIMILPGRKCEDIGGLLEWSERVDCINLLLLVVAACVIFLMEHRKNTYPLIYSSYQGRGRTYLRKMGCLILFAILLSILTTICLVSMTATYGSMESWLQDIQHIQILTESPYVWNVLQLTMVITALRALGYITLVCVFAMVSMGFKTSVLPLVINTLIGIGGVFLCTYYAANYFDSAIILNRAKIYLILQMFTPFTLFCDGMGYISEYHPVNLFGTPVAISTMCIISNISIILLVMVIGYVIYVKRYRRSGI